MESKGQKLLTLFWTFFKIGAFTFGGGYAMIPLIQREVAETHKWIGEEDILDTMVIAQSAPGALAINSATLIGYKVAGFWGALLSTLGVVLPSYVVISILSLFIMQFKELTYVSYAFEGIRAGVVVLIINAVVKLSKNCRRGAFNICIILAVFLLSTFTGFNIIYMLAISAVVGIVYHLFLIKDFKEEEKPC